MRKLLDKGDMICTRISMGAVLIIMCATSVDALARYLFNRPIRGVYEITEQYLMVLAVFLAARRAYQEGALIRVTFFADHMPACVKLGLNYFAQLFSAVLAILYVASQVQQTFRSIASNMTIDIWNLPVWPAYVVTCVGLLLLATSLVLDLTRVRSGDSCLFKEETPEGMDLVMDPTEGGK